MKNFKIIMTSVTLILTSLFILSCQQNNPTPNPPPTTQGNTQITGNWNFDFIRNITYTGSGNPIVITDSTIYDTPMIGQWYEVTLSQFIMHVAGNPVTSPENYSLSGSTITFGASDVYSIKVLNQTSMVLRKTVSSTQFSERHYTRI